MLAAPSRRAAVALAALLALGAAPLLSSGPAGAAVADSAVSIPDPSGDVNRAGSPATEPKADIVAASVRDQNDFISLTMKLAKGDDLSGTAASDYVRWAIGAHQNTSPDFIVQLKRGANGFGEVVVFPPGDAQIPCPNAVGSFDGVNGLYLASVPAKCVGSPTSFQWAAQRSIAPPSGSVLADPATDTAPDDGLGKVVSPSPVVGYWAIGSDGKVYNFGDAPKLGDAASAGNTTIDIEAAPHGTGYWTLDSAGVVTAFGPVAYGSLSASDLKAGEKAVSMSGTRTGAGYWIFTNKGRMFAFGDATKDMGDVATLKLNGDIVDSSPTPSGKGYYLTAADGGVFALGDAKFGGSMGDIKLNKPVVAIVPDPDAEGYWLVASDGGVFAFKAPFKGSMGDVKLNKPMRGMVPYGSGYLMVAEDGGVFNFSNKPFSGSTGNNPPTNPMVSITALG
ncbi:MAG TPA: hypothetical protein VGR20_18835 [Acidimicrobiia bacterium]|nr:hypothetical protein [Acidimicrobiia bacterium]